MGVTSSIRNCFEEKPAPDPIPIQIRASIISEDFQYFLRENWYRFQEKLQFDPNKFIFLYSDYSNSQRSLLELWKIVDINKIKGVERRSQTDCYMSSRWKHAIRRGVPISFYKTIIQVLFQNSIGINSLNSVKKYQALLIQKTKRYRDKIQPKSFQEESQQAFKQPFLNQTGQQTLKRITFLLSITSGQLDYNPYILSIISYLLIFVNESTTYNIVSHLIETSFKVGQENKEIMKYHFTLNEYQFEKLAEKFYKTIKKISPTVRTINQHLNTEGIQKIKLFKEIVGNFFQGYLPFSVILKIFMQFLNEGIEIFYRIFYAIIKIAGPGIRDSTTNKQILRSVKSKMFTFLNEEKNVKIFFRYAFDLKLEINYRLMELESIKSRNSSEQGIYFLPNICGISEILSYESVENIWSFLPQAIKHYDLRKIYPQTIENQPYSLKNMVEAMGSNQFTIIVIQCLKGEIFGAFISDKLIPDKKTKNNLTKKPKLHESTPALFSDDHSHEETSNLSLSMTPKNKNYSAKAQVYFGSSQSFVFTIYPNKKKFSSTGENVFYCSYNDNYFAIGGPATKPALQLDSSLCVGLSYNCPTYGNSPLHNGPPGQFRIEKIECFSIQ